MDARRTTRTGPIGHRRRWRRALVCTFALLASLTALPPAQPALAVGESRSLVFLVDGSGSISSGDWQIQKDGLTAALQDAAAFPRDGSTAVGVVQWSYVSSSQQTRVEVPVTVLDTSAAVQSVVDQVQSMSQLGSLTNPGDGVRRGTDLLLGSADAAAEWTLCMSTDGTTNSGEALSSAVTYARSSGVDKLSVVGIEDPPSATAATLNSHYAPHVFGGGSVTIARNAIEFSNLVVGACLGSAVELRALEVNQAVQDWRNSVPVVTGKATAVRAFVQVPAGAEDQRVVGRLYGRRGGSDLPGSPLLAVNPASAVLAQPDVQSRRGDLTASLNFSLPSSWRSGTVELRFDAAGAPLSCQEPGGAGSDPASSCGVTVAFRDEVTPETVFVGVRHSTSTTAQEPSSSELFEQMFRFRSSLPIARMDYRMDRMGDYGSVPDLSTVNSDLALKRFFDTYFCFGCSSPTSSSSRYYGVLSGNGGGLANDIPGTVSSGFLSGTGARGDTGYARNRGPHELAHNLGRHHAVDNSLPLSGGNKVGRCGEVASASAPGHTPFETTGGNVRPVLGPLSSGVDDEVWGLDNRFLRTDTSGLAVIDPRVTFDLMSYCGGGPQARWPSRFTYTGLQGSFPSSGVSSAAVGTGDDVVVVRGTIDFAAGTAALAPVLEMTGNPPASAPGEYEVQLRDAAGNVLQSASFAPEEMDADAPAPNTPTGPPVGMFLVPLPKSASPVASIAVLHGGTVIGQRSASADPPVVSIVAPQAGQVLTAPTVTLSWTASDADRQPLVHTVLYSRDDGDTWDTLTVDTTATTLTLPRSELAGSSAARIKVLTSDGVHVASATSGSFSVADSAPVVAIDVPQDGQVYSGLQDIDLVAAAVDPEDGRLEGSSLSWSSDRGGVTGTGEELGVNAADLAEGEHVITVTATDSRGTTAVDQVRIRVFRVAPPPEPPVITADVQVQAGSDPAPVALRRSGVVPVAILTTDALDATQVDPSTVCFGSATDPAARDCTESHGVGHVEDVDGDGRLDLVLHYETEQTGIRTGDVEACLSGRTVDGSRLRGCDAIRTV